ncbi:MAG TPA: multicopper oxidase family protein [Arachnia sp.]|nr:multicopper oxidase family protein [Arachnia sp.]HMT87118.1 multicopper oxidase family protein [Arachnia sp.]
MQFVWLMLALIAAVLWALVATARDSRAWLLFGAAVATLAQVAASLALWFVGGWWFAGEKLLVGAPLGLVALAWFTLVRRNTRWMRPAAWAGMIAQLVALAATVIVGYPGPGAAAPSSTAHEHGQTSPGPSADSVSVTELRTPQDRPPDVAVTIEARQTTVTLPSGRVIETWSFGELGGPVIEASVGELVEVTVRNRDIENGVTAHWHGYRVPNGEDGVAGVTQDAVLPGEEFVYRFVAAEPGTYWYHTHQISSEGVSKGLYGPLVVRPELPVADLDAVFAVHTFGGHLVLGASDDEQRMQASPGDVVRLRLINTDQQPQVLELAGAPFRVVAVDGRDLNGPELVEGQAVRIPAGGRYDLEYTQPSSAVALRAAASRTATVVLGDGVAPPATFARILDLLAYGRSSDPGPTDFDVEAELVLDQLPRLFDGGLTYAYTIGGKVYPHVPPTEVDEGDLVRLTVVNRSFETHPMHPHGHVVRVLSVNGAAPTGSPLVLDTFDVAPGEVWVVALTADNPGVWMDHCHNLEHAALGMVTHLVYRGVISPFEHGGEAGNQPE